MPIFKSILWLSQLIAKWNSSEKTESERKQHYKAFFFRLCRCSTLQRTKMFDSKGYLYWQDHLIHVSGAKLKMYFHKVQQEGANFCGCTSSSEREQMYKLKYTPNPTEIFLGMGKFSKGSRFLSCHFCKWSRTGWALLFLLQWKLYNNFFPTAFRKG